MGKKTKIDWCDSTWNPVTGCEHRCPYCYAKGIAKRFGTNWLPDENPDGYKLVLDGTETHAILELDGMQARKQKDGKIVPAEFPLGFTPTLHRYRLDEPRRWTKPRTIFVCSMADLFGKWVPDSWIEEVVKACEDAPQHRYLFLTKNPDRYNKIDKLVHWPSQEETFIEMSRTLMMLGASATNNSQMQAAYDSDAYWVSIEPIHEEIAPEWFISASGSLHSDEYKEFSRWEWVVIGAETGNSKNRVRPEKEWIDDIVRVCKEYGTPVFMKESLRELMGSGFIQEFPWEV